MPDIVDSDEELEYDIKDIDLICQEPEEDIDINELLDLTGKVEKILIQPEEDIKDIIYDISLGEDIKNRFQTAVDTKTPLEFIYTDKDGQNFSLFNKLKAQEDALNIFKHYRINYRIGINNFIFAYIISNYNIFNKDDILDNIEPLNDIFKFNIDKDNYERILESYKLRLDTLFKKTQESMENAISFYDRLGTMEYSTNPEKIAQTLTLNETSISIDIMDGEYNFSSESGSIIFNQMSNSYYFPFIQYNGIDQKFYKIYEREAPLEEILNAHEKIARLVDEDERKNENYIFVLLRLPLTPREKFIMLEFDLQKEKLYFDYPGNLLDTIKDKIRSHLLNDIIFKQENVLDIKGNFELEFNNYDSTRMYFLTLFDDIIGKFLFVKEYSRPRSLASDRDKYYFKSYSQSNNLGQYSVRFFLEPLYANRYKIEFSSKVINNSSINEFALIMSKLAWYYNHIENPELEINYSVVTKPYTGKDGEGLGGNLEDKGEKSVTFKSKKLDTLLAKAPEIFPKNEYSRNCGCPKQPIIIDNDDIKSWDEYRDRDGKKHEVVTFPPENSSQRGRKYNFVCPSENPVMSFIPNPDSFSEYPILPCCTKMKKSDLYDNYEKIRENPSDFFIKREEGKTKYASKKTISLLGYDQKGIVPEELNIFFRGVYENGKFSRIGVQKNSKSSLLHCLLKASKHLGNLGSKVPSVSKKIEDLAKFQSVYDKKSSVKQEQIVDILRKNIYKYVNINVASQENYSLNERQILQHLENSEEVLESQYYYRVMEHMFYVNLFVFVYDNGRVTLEQPYHRFFHLREYNLKLPTVILFKHVVKNSINVYELIKAEENVPGSNYPYLFTDVMTKYIKNYIEERDYYICQAEGNNYDVRKNYYDNINWHQILADYEIVGQSINDSGRTFRINIKLDNGNIMSLYTPPSFPLNAPLDNVVYKSDIEDIEKRLGEEYIEGSEGLWFTINGDDKGLFIPCHDISKKKSNRNMIYELEKNQGQVDYNFLQLSTISRNANIIKQLLVWCWNLSPISEISDWFDKYVIVSPEEESYSVFGSMPINVEYRFPNYINTTEEGVEYLSSFIPLIFRTDKIYFYDKLYNNMKQYLLNYDKATVGIKKTTQKAIFNAFSNEKDFTSRPYTRIIIGEQNWQEWYNFITVLDLTQTEIEESDDGKIRPFLYKNKEGHIYLIQNNELGTKQVALLINKVWSEIKLNLGFYTTLTNIWNCIDDNQRLLEIAGMSKSDVIDKANQYSDKKIKSFCQALTYLETNEINFDITNECDYIIARRDGSYEKKGSCKDKYQEIWEFDNGHFASMLRII